MRVLSRAAGRAQDPARSGVGDDLGETLRLSERQRTAGRDEREPPDLDVDPLLLRVLLTEADVRDLRLGVHAVRHGVVVGDALGMARYVLDRADTLVRG